MSTQPDEESSNSLNNSPALQGSSVLATTPALYIVSTPIGNMADITYRAVEVLRAVDLIAAEDTRHSGVLLKHLGIQTPMASYHEHNEARTTPLIVERIAKGESVALISDAGTPLLSDPGSRLVRAAIDAGISVIPIPGASAVLAAYVGSGFGGGAFTFIGFMDRKGKGRSETLDSLVNSPVPIIFYESPNRVVRTLEEIAALGAGDRPVAVGRELTKLYESFYRGSVLDVINQLNAKNVRGEVVVVLGGREKVAVSEDELTAEAHSLARMGLSGKAISKELVNRYGIARNDAYRIAQEANLGNHTAAPATSLSEESE